MMENEGQDETVDTILAAAARYQMPEEAMNILQEIAHYPGRYNCLRACMIVIQAAFVEQDSHETKVSSNVPHEDEAMQILRHLQEEERLYWDVIEIRGPYLNEMFRRPLYDAVCFAIQIPVDVSFLRKIMEHDPQCARTKNWENLVLLHKACEGGAPIDLIQLLVEFNPDAVREMNFSEELPLHIACRVETPCTETVRLLLSLYPQGASVQDTFGKIPLHNALKDRAAPIEVLRALVDCFPAGTGTANSCDGMLPLHYACSCKSVPLEIVQWLANIHSEGLMTRTKESKIGDLPLHYALEQCHETDIIRCLLDAYPEGIRARDHLAILPLHFACVCFTNRDSYPLDTVKLLLERGPDIIKERSKHLGWLPLHVACSGANLAAVPLLLERYREGARIRADSGMLPVHLACLAALERGPVQLLVDAYPESLNIADNDGRLPLHHACNGMASVEILRLLLELYPEAIRAVTTRGYLPLHEACAYNHTTLEKFRLLVEADPLAVFRRAPPRGVTPLQLCFSQRGPRAQPHEIKWFLLTKQRETVQMMKDAIEDLGLPDLVAARIWEFSETVLWEPEGEEWAEVNEGADGE